MAIDPSIIGGLRQPEIMTPAQAIQLRNIARAGQLQELQMMEAQRTQQNRNAMLGITGNAANWDQSTGGLTPQAIQQVGQFDPQQSLELGNQRSVRLSQLSVEAQRKAEAAERRAGALKESMPGIVNAYDIAFEKTGGNAQESLRLATEARNTWLDELQKSGRASALGITEQELQQARAAPLNIDQMRAQVESPAARARRNEPKSALGKLEADYKSGRVSKADYDKEKAKMTAPTANMSLTGEGALSDDALNLAVDQYMAGDTTAAQGYARNAQMKAQFMNRLAERAKARNMSGADLAQKTAEFQGMKAGERTLGTRTANVEMAVAEAQNVMPIAVAASEAVDRTKYPTLNSILLAAQKGTGDENVVRLAAATNSLVNIYARAISPSGTPTVSDKDHAREILSTAYSKGQFKAATDIMSQELAAARKSPGQVKESMRDGGGDLKSQVEQSGWAYEPDKYDYRVQDGKVQRKKKGG